MPTLLISAISWDPRYHLEVAGRLISVHSLGIVVGYVVGYLVLKRRATARGLWNPAIDEAVVVAVPGVLLGSRFFWALPLWLSGQDVPGAAVTTTRFTNISFLGGLAGGLAFGIGWLLIRRVSIRSIAGLLSESIGLGLLIARAGDVIVSDHLGRQTDLAFGYRLPPGAAPNGACLEVGDVCHQTALYELLAVAAILSGALLLRQRGAPEIRLLGYLLAGYGSTRFLVVEPFRVTPEVMGLTGSQWTSLAVLLAGVLLWSRSSSSFLEARRLDTEPKHHHALRHSQLSSRRKGHSDAESATEGTIQ